VHTDVLLLSVRNARNVAETYFSAFCLHESKVCQQSGMFFFSPHRTLSLSNLLPAFGGRDLETAALDQKFDILVLVPVSRKSGEGWRNLTGDKAFLGRMTHPNPQAKGLLACRGSRKSGERWRNLTGDKAFLSRMTQPNPQAKGLLACRGSLVCCISCTLSLAQTSYTHTRVHSYSHYIF